MAILMGVGQSASGGPMLRGPHHAEPDDQRGSQRHSKAAEPPPGPFLRGQRLFQLFGGGDGVGHVGRLVAASGETPGFGAKRPRRRTWRVVDRLFASVTLKPRYL